MSPKIKTSLLDLHPRELKGIIKEIPTLPLVYQELFQRMQNPEATVSEIADLVAQDQALTAKILHLVNSAFYGLSKQVTTISRAVVILGFKSIRSAALAISVFDYFKDEASTEELDMTQFWSHSIAVATISKVLAEEIQIKLVEESFTIGLLHDVGKLIEKHYFPKDFEDLFRVSKEQNQTWIDCERELFQVNHATIGKVVFRMWDFPPSVVEAVQLHHSSVATAKFPQLTALVQVADYVSYGLGYGSPGSIAPDECPADSLKLLGLSMDQIENCHGQINEALESSMEILKLMD